LSILGEMNISLGNFEEADKILNELVGREENN
jgi:hypothetical protein